MQSKTKVPHGITCKVCGERVYSKCGICGVGLHDTNSKSEAGMKTCFIDYHDTLSFGLCKEDAPVVGLDAKEWTPITPAVRKEQKSALKRLETGAMATRRSNRSV